MSSRWGSSCPLTTSQSCPTSCDHEPHRLQRAVSWQVRDAPVVLIELAQAGRVVFGLDMRDSDDDGTFLGIAGSVYNRADPVEVRAAARVSRSAPRASRIDRSADVTG